ncbi:MAG: hypothetical protein F9K18_06630, partial [Thermoanaerobaculia bacterium]
MPFPYYARLTERQKRTYRKSDALPTLEVPGVAELAPVVEALAGALAGAERRAVERSAQTLAREVCVRLDVVPVEVRVLAARPTGSFGELHGLYEPKGRRGGVVTVWMRTAARREVVAFRTFLRTLVHELLHHLDYELLGLEETFHTEGFFRRESGLVRQLLGEPPPAPPEEAARG